MRVKTDSGVREYRTLWMESSVYMIDQPKLPHEFSIYESKSLEDTCSAIKEMVVRGAPAIGAAAAYGMAQAAFEYEGGAFLEHMNQAAETLKRTRPTAYDLFHAVDHMLSLAGKREDASYLKGCAQAYADKSADMCRMIGEHGQNLLDDGMRILTHCNAGALGCVDHGTALAPLRAARDSGKNPWVYVDETRPRCQGSRLTAWELAQEEIGYSVIADNAAGYFMRKGEIDLVIVGADRIAANHDVANKVGTYEKAVIARENNIPFYVAAPKSTFDKGCQDGDEIEIEERSEDEVLGMWGVDDTGRWMRIRTSPREARARNPAFDITPARYITGFITEEGVFEL